MKQTAFLNQIKEFCFKKGKYFNALNLKCDRARQKINFIFSKFIFV